MNSIFIGFDSRERSCYYVAKHSIESRASVPVDIQPIKLSKLAKKNILTRPIERKDGKLWCPISNAPMTTEFAISRFAVPFLAKTGWALFVDCDIVCLSDIAELFALADERYAVMCVKHNQSGLRAWKYRVSPRTETIRHLRVSVCGRMFVKDVHDGVAWIPARDSQPGAAEEEVFGQDAVTIFKSFKDEIKEGIECGDDYLIDHYQKMDAQIQTFYPCKNWSSVVLWNCDHPGNKNLTLEVLNGWPGRDLHAFKWLKDEEIGGLLSKWNYLVGVNTEPAESSGIYHFTLGGPWFKDWKGGPLDDIWMKEQEACNKVET